MRFGSPMSSAPLKNKRETNTILESKDLSSRWYVACQAVRRLPMSTLVLSGLGAIVLVLVFLALSAIRVVQQYERGVFFFLGRLTGAKGSGLFLVPPLI